MLEVRPLKKGSETIGTNIRLLGLKFAGLAPARCVASKRFVTGDGNAMAVTALRIVIPQRQMLGAAIVPKRDRAGAPVEAALEFGIFDVPEEHLENRVALALLQLHDSSGEHPIHVNSLAPGLRMSPYHRMLRARECFSTTWSGTAAFVVARTVVDGGQAVQKTPH